MNRFNSDKPLNAHTSGTQPTGTLQINWTQLRAVISVIISQIASNYRFKFNLSLVRGLPTNLLTFRLTTLTDNNRTESGTAEPANDDDDARQEFAHRNPHNASIQLSTGCARVLLCGT